MEFQSSQNNQNQQSISKKKFTGQICPERAEASGFCPDLARQ
jgi:hypothetical protein